MKRRFRIAAVVTLVLLSAGGLLADGTLDPTVVEYSLTNPDLADPGWWAWMLGRIGVPGG